MKNWFSLKLYVEGLRKIKVAGFAAAITVIALNALLPITGIIESSTVGENVVRNTSVVPTILFAPFGLAMMVFSAIFVYSMFSYLNERNKSDFWHAIPHKRTCVYFSFIAAIYTWIAAILLVSGLVNLLLWNFAKYYVASFSSFAVTLGVYFLAAIMLVGFMSVAMTLTGTVVSNLLILTLLILFVRTVGGLFTVSLSEVVPMFDIDYSVMRFLEFEFFLPFSLLIDLFDGDAATFGNAALLIYSVIASLVLTGIGAFIYHIRKSEMATHSAPSKVMQHVYRCAIVLPLCFLLVYLMMMYTDETLLAIMLIVILLVWVIFELMTTKKIKNVVKSLPVLVVPLVLSLVFLGSVYLGREIIWADVPDADEIQGVSLSGSSSSTFEQIQTKNIMVEDKALNHLVAEALLDTVESEKSATNIHYYGGRHVVIHLKSGRTIGRYLSMNETDYISLRDGFYTSEAYRSALLSMPTGKQIDSIDLFRVNVSQDTAKRIWASYLLEYSLLSDDEKRAIKSYRLYDGYASEFKSDDEAVGYIYVDGRVGFEDFYSQYPILYCYTPETAAMYLEIRNENESISGKRATDDIASLRELIEANRGSGYLEGWIAISDLYGDVEFDSFSYGFAEDLETSVDNVLEALVLLEQLEHPDDYDAEVNKSILLIELSINTYVKYAGDLNNLALPEEKAAITSEYVYMEIPVAMTKEQAIALQALWSAISKK